MHQVRLSSPHRAGFALSPPAGAESLHTYTFNTHTAKHLFCKVCGIKAFHVPRSHPGRFSVNARCLDAGTVEAMTVEPIDGRNWETHYPEGRGRYDDA